MKVKTNISVIEDNEFYANIVKWKLAENPGFNITIFNSPEGFFQKKQLKHDIVIIDYHLGKGTINGLEVAKKIKKTPKIFISAQKDISNAIAMVKEGVAVDYIDKDISALDRLVESTNDIAEQLQYHKALKKLKVENKKRSIRLFSIIGVSAVLLLASLVF